MRKITYPLFPISLRIFGLIFVILSIYSLYSAFYGNYNPDKLARAIGGPIGFFVIGLILITTNSTMRFDKENFKIVKAMHILGFKMQDEITHIPKDWDKLIIKQKNKDNTGYYDLMIPINYKIKSGDMYFVRNRSLIRLMNTDVKQALKVAMIIKEEFNIDYDLL
jgi:hypothetical protein